MPGPPAAWPRLSGARARIISLTSKLIRRRLDGVDHGIGWVEFDGRLTEKAIAPWPSAEEYDTSALQPDLSVLKWGHVRTPHALRELIKIKLAWFIHSRRRSYYLFL